VCVPLWQLSVNCAFQNDIIIIIIIILAMTCQVTLNKKISQIAFEHSSTSNGMSTAGSGITKIFGP